MFTFHGLFYFEKTTFVNITRVNARNRSKNLIPCKPLIQSLVQQAVAIWYLNPDSALEIYSTLFCFNLKHLLPF